MARLDDAVVLVTGAAQGMGRTHVEHLLDLGARVVATDLRGDAVEDLGRRHGDRAVTMAHDVTSDAEWRQVVGATVERFGRLDGLVNNAGILERQSDVVDMSRERWQRILDVNVIGSFLCAREAIKRMSTATGGQGGSIVNLSSRAADLGAPHEYVDYAASKGAVDALTIGLAKEVGDQGIRVNAVKPGLIYTDIHADSGEAGRVDRLKTGVPMQRGGLPLEVAEAILWLLSDAASYTTGSFIDVSGGR